MLRAGSFSQPAEDGKLRWGGLMPGTPDLHTGIAPLQSSLTLKLTLTYEIRTDSPEWHFDWIHPESAHCRPHHWRHLRLVLCILKIPLRVDREHLRAECVFECVNEGRTAFSTRHSHHACSWWKLHYIKIVCCPKLKARCRMLIGWDVCQESSAGWCLQAVSPATHQLQGVYFGHTASAHHVVPHPTHRQFSIPPSTSKMTFTTYFRNLGLDHTNPAEVPIWVNHAAFSPQRVFLYSFHDAASPAAWSCDTLANLNQLVQCVRFLVVHQWDQPISTTLNNSLIHIM